MLETPQLDSAEMATRQRGFIIPAVSGSYEFSISSYEYGELYLSTTGAPGDQADGLELISYNVKGTNYEWDKRDGQVSVPIQLEAGRAYLFEARNSDYRGYPGYLNIGWKQPGASEFAAISSAYLASWQAPLSDPDGDGIPTDQELAHGLDPSLSADGLADPDQDGLNNTFEITVTGTDPNLADTDGDGQGDGLEYLAGADPLDGQVLTPALDVLPAGWSFSAIGAPAGRYHYASSTSGGDILILGSGAGLESSAAGGDSMSYLHRQVSGEFSIIVELDYAYGHSPWAGLMLRESLAADARALSFTGNITKFNKQLQLKNQAGAPSQQLWDEGGEGRLIRLERKDNLITAYIKTGEVWTRYAETEDIFTDQLYVGAVVHSTDADVALAINLKRLELSWVDSDNDGISDLDEQALGTDPNLADTDGDGYSDYEELHTLFTDPLTPDLVSSTLISSQHGAQGVVSTGSWAWEGDAAYTTSVHGTLDFTVNLPADGVYRLELDLGYRSNYNAISNVYPVEISVDGQFIDRVNVVLIEGSLEQALAHVVTPWLSAGSHQVSLFFDNTHSYRSLQVNALRVQELGGPDTDNDGIADWIEHRLAQLNSVEEMPPASFTSPVCVEGSARFLSTAALSVGTTSYPLAPIPGQNWYADVPLDPDASIQLDARFENGGLTESISLDWEALNLFELPAVADERLWYGPADEILIRAGDELRVTAFPAGATGGTTDLEVTVAGAPDPLDQFTLTVGGDDVFYTFASAGSYTLHASYDDGSGTLQTTAVTIEVLDGSFAGDPYAGINTARPWENPQIEAELALEVDQGVTLTDPQALSGGGLRFSLKTLHEGASQVAARLAESGPVLDVATVTGIRVANSYDTSVDIIETYADGSQVWGFPILLSTLPPEVELRVQIIKNGVIFHEPGGTEGQNSNWRIYTAADFDEYGRLYVQFLRSADQNGATCHRLHLYVGDVFLGNF